jgi:hypothetical protein
VQAERVALELDGEKSQYCDALRLKQQLCSLDRLLPGLDVNAMLCQDSLILTTDVGAAAQRLVTLDVMLGSPNLVQLLHVAPQLLYAEVCSLGFRQRACQAISPSTLQVHVA